jgi:hypothetical protein
MKYAIALGLAIALIGTVQPTPSVMPQADVAIGPPTIKVEHCLLSFKGFIYNFSAWFSLGGPSAYRSLTWRARVHGGGWVDLKTTRAVKPGSSDEVSQRFVMNPQSPGYISLDDPSACTLIGAETVSGQTWTDPLALPPTVSLPTRPPNDATPLPATIDNLTRDPIGIIGCNVHVDGPLDYYRAADLEVRFKNISSKVIHQITFRAFDGSGGVDFLKQGTYSPGVFVLTSVYRQRLPDAGAPFESLERPDSCAAVSATYADGTTWQAPEAGPTSIPTCSPLDTKETAPCFQNASPDQRF